jgi:hypothetical protein
MLSSKWKVDLPEEAASVLSRTDEKFGPYSSESYSPPSRGQNSRMSPSDFAQIWQPPPPDRNSFSYDSTRQVDGIPRATTITSRPGYATSASNPAGQYAPAGVPGSNPRIQFNSSTSTSSPSGVYDGVEQLVQDSQDWMMRDQAQLANGFENWTGVTDFDMSLWAGNASSGRMNRNSIGLPTSTGISIPANSMPMEGAMAYDGSWDWLNYDERSWYA